MRDETRDLLKGIWVPFLLPRASHDDMGKALDDTYLPAVRSAFNAQLPQYAFTNHHKGKLAGKLSVAAGSRHSKLIEAMRKDAVVGLFFPCLTEYSIGAAREQIAQLPEEFLLAGGIDTCAALIAAPDLLLNKEAYSPLLWFAALDGEKADVGYHFEAYGYNLTFNRRVHLGHADEYWASSLVLLG